MCLLKAYECNIVVLIYSLDELTNCEIESPPKHQRLPLFKSRNRPLGGGFLLFRPTDDGSDTARGSGWGGGGTVLMMAYTRRLHPKGVPFEALGIRKGRDFTS